MSPRTSRRCTVALAAALLGLAAAHAADAQPRATARVAADRTAVHARCDTASPVRAPLVKGQTVEIENVVDGWVYVILPETGEKGCMRRSHLEPLPSLDRAEEAYRRREQERTRTAAPPGTTPAPPPPDRTLRLAVFGHAGAFSPTATKSFDAILGTTTTTAFGGGAQVAVLAGALQGLFVEVEASRLRETGERAFVHDNEVFRLGIPVTITMTPLEVTAGYRLVLGQRTRAGAVRAFPIVPYGGGGVGSVRYQETDAFAQPDEEIDDRFTSYHVLGGVEVAVWRWILAGVEVRYRWVPDGLGAGGVSREFDETDLGGTSVRVRFGVGF